MESRVECTKESNAEQRARRSQQRKKKNRDESRWATRAVLRPKQHREEQNRGTKAQRCRGARAQTSKGAKAKTGCFVLKEKRETTSRNAGEKRSYIWCAMASGARGYCSQAHTRRDAHLASLTPFTGAAQARNCVNKARAQRGLRSAPQACGV